ncbi:MAG: hypothetical protein M1818_006579 [Claussenomyces sp. TS43310]|nr:MAG: hypothetical protein M1818_006579 [Claussenomyces sp. TS43310]
MAGPSQGAGQDEWGGSQAIMGDPEEQRVLQYARVAHYNTTHLRRQSFYALPQSHWQLLASPPFSYLDTLNAVDDAIDENAELAMAIFRTGLSSFGQTIDLGDAKKSTHWQGSATSADVEKARSTIRQFYRDWSEEGAAERKACYSPIICDLRQERITSAPNNSPMNVLVPGAGLGRLVFELCQDGFNVEGNEISYHQLLASSYVLNYCPCPKAHTIYPWIHSFSNHSSRSAQLQSVEVPDVHPGTVLQQGHDTLTGDAAPHARQQPGEMSMSASDFLLLYDDASHQETYDAVATCFFLDTAPNPIRYIQTIRNCLKLGGIWTNLGPLLWHFENNPPGKHGNSDSDGPAVGPDAAGK